MISYLTCLFVEGIFFSLSRSCNDAGIDPLLGIMLLMLSEFFLIYPKFSRYFITSWISPPPIQFPKGKKSPAGEETQGSEIMVKSPSGLPSQGCLSRVPKLALRVVKRRGGKERGLENGGLPRYFPSVGKLYLRFFVSFWVPYINKTKKEKNEENS